MLSGETVPKDGLRLKVCGAVDELQSHLGMARALIVRADVKSILHEIQLDLFIVGAEISAGNDGLSRLNKRVSKSDVGRLEEWIDDFTEQCGLPGGFLVPGNTNDSAVVHVARAVCRRVERLMVTLGRGNQRYAALLAYFNRLSDLLFVLAWVLEFRTVIEDVVRRLMVPNGKQPTEI